MAAVCELLKQHYKKDDNTSAFETWKEFKIFYRENGQTADGYITCYEKCKIKMRRFKMDLSEHIHGLNLLRAANLSDPELCTSMREVNTEYLNEMYMQGKKSLKKYLGSSSISNNPTHGRHPVALVTPKQEPLFASVEEYETYVAWKQSNRLYNQRGNPYNYSSTRDSSSPPKYPTKRNSIERDGLPPQCHIC